MKIIDNKLLNGFVKKNQIPNSISDNLHKLSDQIEPILDNDKIAVVLGGKAKRQGVGKTLFWMIQGNMRKDIAIFGPTYDWAEEKVNPKDPDKIGFHNFETPTGFIKFVKDNYPLMSDYKKDQLEDWYESGIPADILKKRLPDDGKAYDQMNKNIEHSSVITQQSMIFADWVEDKNVVNYDENPHKTDTYEIKKPFIGDKSKFNWSEDDVEDILDVSDDVAEKDGIINDIVALDIQKDVGEGTMMMFLDLMKKHQDKLDDIQDTIQNVNSRSDKEDLLGDKWLIDRNKYWHVLDPIELEAQKQSSNGKWHNPVQYFYNSVYGKLMERIEDNIDNGNINLAKSLASFRKELSNLMKLDEDWDRVVNFSKHDGTNGQTVNKGESIFTTDSNNNKVQSYVTLFRQHLDRLEELSEGGTNVVISYAGTNMDLLNGEKVEIDTGGNLKTNVKHFNSSFSKNILDNTEKKRNLVKTVQQLKDDVGTVSYKGYLNCDLYYFGAEGREELAERKNLIVAGTPRLADLELAKMRLKFFSRFPSKFNSNGVREDVGKIENGHYGMVQDSKMFGKIHNIDGNEKKAMVIGYKDDKLDTAYTQVTLKTKLDAMFRIRKQMEEEKNVYVFGQLPPEAYDIFPNIDSYDTYREFFDELKGDMILKSDKTEWELPYYPSVLPGGLYRRGNKIYQTGIQWQAEMIEYVHKSEVLTLSELEEMINSDQYRENKSRRTITRAIKKHDELIYYPGGGSSESTIERSFGIIDLFSIFDSKK